MELKMNEYQLPEEITFNFEELKAELKEKTSYYETLVYTETQIAEAKKDKANLNKLKTALNNERIRLEKEYMQPFNVFKGQINEVIGIINKPIEVIDKQIKEAEDKRKADKLNAVKELWESMEHPKDLPFEKVFVEKFLNSTCNMKTVKQYFVDAIDKFNRDVETLHNLPEYSFEAIEVYKTTFDIRKGLDEAHRLSEMQKRKAEAERQKVEQEKLTDKVKEVTQPQKPIGQAIASIERQAFENCMNPPVEELPTEPLKEYPVWIAFKALLTTEDAFALRDFFQSRNIEFEAI